MYVNTVIVGSSKGESNLTLTSVTMIKTIYRSVFINVSCMSVASIRTLLNQLVPAPSTTRTLNFQLKSVCFPNKWHGFANSCHKVFASERFSYLLKCKIRSKHMATI